MLDSTDRTETGISKLIGHCALEKKLMFKSDDIIRRSQFKCLKPDKALGLRITGHVVARNFDPRTLVPNILSPEIFF